jgi:DNA recombination protein RmuC
MTAAALIIGLALGALAVWLWARGELRSRDARLESADQARALAERTQAQWDEQLKALTHDALASSQTRLVELTDAKLQPIKETLDRFDEAARKLEEKRVGSVVAIGAELKRVAEGQERLRSETGNLATALRRPDVRGRWGEIQLKRVIELAGMVDHCDFRMQQSVRDDEGQLVRPDLVVRLPGGKSIVVDSKVSVDAYLDAVACDEPVQRKAHLERHASQVRDHMAKLAQKAYWQRFDDTPEFVVMFVDEGIFRAALDADPSLFEKGFESGVVLASPSSLIALLRTAAYGWQQERVATSAREIADLGRQLYERLGVFAGAFSKVGKALDGAVKEYNVAAGSLESRLLVTARKFPNLGAGTDELPETKPVERTARQLFAPDLDAPDDVAPLVRHIDAA